ncbi:hypothetical protein BDF14DRAFT_1743281 [Spinellus fusiger]|nr:hypothetical protein BDF14DRAFT_1743281 [Spinellus fusiger]
MAFLADYESNKNLHKYRSISIFNKKSKSQGKSDNWEGLQNFSEKIISSLEIKDMERNIDEAKLVKGHESVCHFIKRILGAIKTPSLSHSENVFINMDTPCLYATIQDEAHLPYLVPEEEELFAMTVQRNKMSAKVDHRKIHKAGSIVWLQGLQNL